MSSEEGFAQTVELAQYAEQLGYHRYWLSEHHSSHSIIGSAPEILASFLIAKTSKIQIGTGGVMLTHYNPYKIAEQFKVMSALAPDRVNIGVGRAPGGAHLSTIALQGGRSLEDGWKRDKEGFPEQIDELLEYLEDELSEAHPFRGYLHAAPIVEKKPDVWVLGTSSSSAILAAEKGLPFAFAQFINHEPGEMAKAIYQYREQFNSSKFLKQPKAIAAMKIIVANTDEEAAFVAKSALYVNFLQHRSQNARIIRPEDALIDVKTEKEKQEIEDLKSTYLLGSKETVARQIKNLTAVIPIDELMAVSPIYDITKRKRSFELLKEAVVLAQE